MPRSMSLFWYMGARLTIWKWEQKDAQIDLRRAHFEDLSLDEWAAIPADEHLALCEELGGFRPEPHKVNLSDDKLRLPISLQLQNTCATG